MKSFQSVATIISVFNVTVTANEHGSLFRLPGVVGLDDVDNVALAAHGGKALLPVDLGALLLDALGNVGG